MSMKQQAEIRRLQRELEELREELAALHARVDVLEEKRGPGRPKKVANA